MNANRKRAILAAQKVRLVSDPRPVDRKLTAEERKAMYAPKSALAIIPNRPAMPIRAARSTAKASGVLMAMITAVSAGILLGESKRGIRT
jgi:hypothetical protein